MKPTLFSIDHPGPGHLSTMAKPRGGDWLSDEMVALRRAGVDVIVSALTAMESQEVGLEAEAHEATSAAVHFLALPIADRDVPDADVAMPVLDALDRHLLRGDHVVIHCRFGIGRASLIAAALLVRAGLAPDDAWSRVGRARGLAVPDTDAQRQWVADRISPRT
jgi:predicted protein tyrosine phosphatase